MASKASSTNQAKFEFREDRSLLVSEQTGKATYTIQFPTTLKSITGLRLEALADPSLPGGGPGLPPNGNFVITELEVQFASEKEPKKREAVTIGSGKADFTQGGFNVNHTFNGNKRNQQGWAIHNAMGVDHWATYRFKKPIENPDGGTLLIQLHQYHNAAEHRLGHFRISATTAATGRSRWTCRRHFAPSSRRPQASRSDTARKRLTDYIGRTDPDKLKGDAALAEAKKPVPRDDETVQS